jgi:hypothetical protein
MLSVLARNINACPKKSVQLPQERLSHLVPKGYLASLELEPKLMDSNIESRKLRMEMKIWKE